MAQRDAAGDPGRVPTVNLTKAPLEGWFTGPDVVVSFDATPGCKQRPSAWWTDAEAVPLAAAAEQLRDGSHTIQVEADLPAGGDG